MQKRSLWTLPIIAALAASTAACGGSPSGGGDTAAPLTLTIWVDDKRAPAVIESAERFQAESGVTVSVETIAKELQTQFVTAAQAGKGPDLVLGAHDWIGNLVQNGTIDPLQMTDAQKARFEPLAIRGVTFDGQIYGVPFAVANVVLIRNTDLVPDVPDSIEDMVSTAKRLRSEGKVDELLALPIGQTGDFYHLYPLFTSGGGYLFGQDAQGNYDPKDFGLTKPGAKAAFEKIEELGEKGDGALKRSISAENVTSVFSGGKAPFMISGPWQFAELNKTDLKYDVSPVPAFEGGRPAKPFVTVDALYVASRAKNKTLAQEFATSYFTRTDTAVALYRTDPRPPALIEALDQVKGSDPTLVKVLEAGKAGDIMPAIPAMATVWDPLGKAEAAVVGGAPPGSTVDAAAAAIESQIR